jgi:hypothetical protein
MKALLPARGVAAMSRLGILAAIVIVSVEALDAETPRTGTITREQAQKMIADWFRVADVDPDRFDITMDAHGRVELNRANARVAFTYDARRKVLRLHRVALMTDEGGSDPEFRSAWLDHAAKRYFGRPEYGEYVPERGDKRGFFLITREVAKPVSGGEIKRILNGFLADEAEWWLSKGFLEVAHIRHAGKR